jgi:hypothetical protein
MSKDSSGENNEKKRKRKKGLRGKKHYYMYSTVISGLPCISLERVNLTLI